MTDRFKTTGRPDRNDEYLLYQTLVGAWPIEIGRVGEYMQKAAREAKRHTSWDHTNEAYEDALAEFIRAALTDDDFAADVDGFVASIARWGFVNSLSETLVKLTAPGVPDIYQGSELWNLSLVDPDNRRPVDYGLRRMVLNHSKSVGAEVAFERLERGDAKLWLIQRVLAFRRAAPKLFGREGDYQPMRAIGKRAEHLLAFMRGGEAITIVPRLVARVKGEWGDTQLPLPVGQWRDVLTGRRHRRLAAPGDLFGGFPVALLVKEPLEAK
jgi:(1->4)-alpha-D-glucan 1-alpha-D-glucosylmutase